MTNLNRVLSPDDWKTFDIPADRYKVRKGWEVTMSERALADIGKGQTVLGVGAGREKTIFQMCKQGALVHATDLYAQAGVWGRWANADMLIDPVSYSPFDIDGRNLIVQHMDMRNLRYHDESFDAVFSAGSIEHVGTFADIAKASAEIGRVLKAGGKVSLSTEWKLSGDGIGWNGVLLFDEDTLQKYIIQPSGLQMTGKLMIPSEYPEAIELASFVTAFENGETVRADDIVLSHAGYTFTSVHIELTKPAKKAKR